MQSKRLRRTSGTFNPLYPPFYVVSDTHWGHDNIVRYCGRPTDHDSLMIENWNEVVGPDDIVLHLGDVFFGQGSFEYFRDIVAPQLNGKKYLILGNHDRPKVDWASLGFKVIDPFSVPFNGWEIEFDHYPTDHTDKIQKAQKRIRVHGHIHNGSYTSKSKNGRRKKASRTKEKSFHVNVSIEMTDYRPVASEEILNAAIKKYRNRQHYRNVGMKRPVAKMR